MEVRLVSVIERPSHTMMIPARNMPLVMHAVLILGSFSRASTPGLKVIDLKWSCVLLQEAVFRRSTFKRKVHPQGSLQMPSWSDTALASLARRRHLKLFLFGAMSLGSACRVRGSVECCMSPRACIISAGAQMTLSRGHSTFPFRNTIPSPQSFTIVFVDTLGKNADFLPVV